MTSRTLLTHAATALTLVLAPATCFAHTENGIAHGILHGVEHPVSGWDHLIAMVAVGLWGAFLGLRAMLLLPIVFPAVMAAGAALGIAAVPMPSVEIGIPASAIVLGLAVALALCPPFWVAGLVVAVFAVFHGYAHGAELPSATSPIGYAIGFLTTTVLLHWLGIAIGLLARWDAGRVMVRSTGVAIALIGAVFLGKSLGIVS